jgi:TatD DNase family protein
MIDTHAHLDSKEFDADRKEVIERTFAEHIEYIIIPAIEPSCFSNIFDIVESYNNIFCSIGIHPHNASGISEKELTLVEEMSSRKKVLAIGEIGLDYYYDFATPDEQKSIFIRQLRIAKERNLPVIIHNRQADKDIINIINSEQNGCLRGVLHCFSSPVEIMNQALDLGFNISFTGNITFKKSNLTDVVLSTPLDRIMLETDSPYMTPVPFRGKRNEPKFVKFVAEKIAEIKSISIEEVIKMTTINAKKLFNLFLIVLLSISFSMNALAKDKVKTTDTLEEGEEYIYKKFIGFGLIGGINTIVQSKSRYDSKQQKEITKDDSDEGIAAYGGTVSAGILDYLFVSVSYVYSKNTKLSEKYPGLKPHIHQIIDISAHAIANPYSRVQFYGTLGVSIFFNAINSFKNNIPDGYDNITRFGFNAGIGFLINLPLDFGMFTFSPEWRLCVPSGTTTAYEIYPNSVPSLVEYQATSFFSIPRITIVFYPKF